MSSMDGLFVVLFHCMFYVPCSIQASVVLCSLFFVLCSLFFVVSSVVKQASERFNSQPNFEWRQGVLYVDVGLSSFATFNFYNNKKAFTRSGLGWELKRSLACATAT